VVTTAAGARAQLEDVRGKTGVPPALSGVVVDSVRRRPLAGAEVVIAGTSISAVSDSVGRFHFDSIPPGSHRVAFFHPLLDSMSVASAPRSFSIPFEEGKGVLLAVPSPATLMRAICQVDDTKGRSLLVGRIRDPDTGSPVAGASVVVSWTDFEVSKRKGIDRSPRMVQGGTDATGAYRVCGLPAEVDAMVYAALGGSSTSRVPVSSISSGVVIRDLALEDPRTASGRRASIAGTVRNSKGAAVAGATVFLPGMARYTVSDAKGEYSLTGIPTGTRTVTVRRLGFSPANISLDLTSADVHRVDAVLSDYVLIMDPMYVIARREKALASIGFTSRKSQGLGQFRVRRDFEGDNPRFLSDIVGRMQGIHVEYVEGRRIVRGVGAGAECVALIVDGMHWETTIHYSGDFDDAVSADQIAALEVYGGPAVPVEFESVVSRGCTTIVLWTKTRVKDFVR
jgi:hypothetical protein